MSLVQAASRLKTMFCEESSVNAKFERIRLKFNVEFESNNSLLININLWEQIFRQEMLNR